MGDDEAPLVLVDTSFLRNGKAGLLLTNRRLYADVRNPAWEEIEQAIQGLDQYRHPLVRLWAGEPEEAPALEILGGNRKYVLRERGEGWIYYNAAGGDEEVEICLSGAGYRCPAFYVCTDLDQVLQTARNFCETGTFDA